MAHSPTSDLAADWLLARSPELQLGVHLGQQNLPIDELRRWWRRFDDAGVDWISAWDHLYEAPPAGGTLDHFEAIATLAALAVDTSHARLGCLVFCMAYRNPGVLARAAVTIDHLSGGRFELGLGAGWHDQEARAFGIDFPPVGVRLDQLVEGTALIRSLFENDRTDHEGTHYSAVDASLLPKPVNGRMPIWIGGVGEKRTLRLVAEQADGWNAAYVSPDEFARLNGVLDQWCERVGRDPNTVQRSINLMFMMSVDDAGADAVDARLRADWGPMADRVRRGALYGTPDTAVERLLEYRAAGADLVNIALRAPWETEVIDAYLDDVIPTVREAASRGGGGSALEDE